MAEKTRCESCDRNFKDEEALAMHNSAKHAVQPSVIKKNHPAIKKLRNYALMIIIAGLIVWGIIVLINKPSFPPTTIEGHVESNPPSHILKEPMPLAIQKHMLEHVDGIDGGRGGVIINYNCKDYECEEGLIEKLESFAKEYDHVYVAPFRNLGAKIALTRLNRIKILEEYNEEGIRSFIYP